MPCSKKNMAYILVLKLMMTGYEAKTCNLVCLYISYNNNVSEYSFWYHQFTQQDANHHNSDNAN
jgi:hypothetical protein